MRMNRPAKTRPAKTRRVMAETEVAEDVVELLFEANDVADLISDVTGEDVTVESDGDVVEFTVGEETFTCEPDEGADTVESSTRILRRKAVKASTRRPVRAGRTVKKLPRRK